MLHILADGEFHSGEDLGQALDITRAAVWKRLQCLAALDIAIETSRTRGYRLVGGLDLLDRERILSSLSMPASELVGNFLCLAEVQSTNTLLLQSGGHGDVCMAERQTAGRGRRGRQWFSPYGRNLYLTVRWHFHQGVAGLEGLSLAVGVVLAEVLDQLGIAGVELKWPNDLLCAGKKLGGILIEVGGDLTGECVVVIGIGMNVHMSAVLAEGDERINQPWADLHQLGFSGSRNNLSGAILSALLPALQDFSQMGFAAYRERWETRCAFMRRPITLILPAGSCEGILLGVDHQGALRVLTEDGERIFSGGEISLRGGV
ncbi:MAG: biotin--[acetyl-CoA-carboxylase] ligase [Cellvibrionaceae bacterium]|nr:biotin--[acetyl-CoA-carboxylase] ligase [Cellvibrionaceae bacterium]